MRVGALFPQVEIGTDREKIAAWARAVEDLGYSHIATYEHVLGAERAGRMEEQIEVLRLLWTRPIVDYRGKWHRIDRAGLNPLPVQRPIPIWIGADSEAGERRAARMADGWFPYLQPDDQGRARLERFRGYVREAVRDPRSVGLEGRVAAARGDVEQWVATARGFRDLGFDYLQFNTMRSGC